MAEFVVMKQSRSDYCADLWDPIYVNVEAESAEAAVEEVAMEKGEGRYVAFPNEFWVAFNATVKRIAEVELDRQNMV